MQYKIISWCWIVAVMSVLAACAGDDEVTAPIVLPAPVTQGGRPLMEVLKDRQSNENFDGKKMPPQILSNMLWAGFGINRPEQGKRTAPSAMNWQEIDIYVVLEDGAYVYDPKNNTLRPVVKGDFRGQTSEQSFAATAPVNLVYVADFARMGDAAESMKTAYSAVDTGFISQNVYLYCASEGLATVVRGWVSTKNLSGTLKLGESQKIVLCQTVGYPVGTDGGGEK